MSEKRTWKSNASGSSFLNGLLTKKSFFGAAFLVLLMTGIVVAKVATHSGPPQQDEIEFVDRVGTIDPNLYQSRLLEDEARLKDEEEAKAKVAPVAEKVAPPPPPPPPPPPARATEVFEFVKPVALVDPEVEAINKGRMGKAIMRIDEGSWSSRKETSEVWENSQKDWTGEGKIHASYPVDMTRVFTVDRYMQCLLYNELDSELPGKVVLQVEQNLFGAHGRKILIPAGTRLVGYYKPLEQVGDERVGLTIERMITPDGISAKLENAEAGDAQGRSGLTGEVDNRFSAKYGLTLAIAAIDTAVKYQIAVENSNTANVVQNFGTQTANISRTILEDTINIKPRVQIPAGTRVQVSPLKDIWFKKAKQGSVQYEEVKG